MEEVRDYLLFIGGYLRLRIINLGKGFEKFKGLIVALLVVKRGKYSLSFLNTSFFLLAGATLVGGPIIAQNSPFISSSTQTYTKNSVISYNPYENSLSTVISVKPRNEVVNYKVQNNDTLATIAKKFDISVNTIKWQNKIKNDLIKPGQILQIPPVTGIVHKVSSGENIYTIAKKYHTDAQKIVNFPFNNFLDLDTFSLRLGQTLFVPDGSIKKASRKYIARKFASKIIAGAKGKTSFTWPTSGVITQYPIWYHMALDIANPASPPVLAADSGRVTYARCIRYGYGCHIIVQHNNGYQTLYGHLQKIYVSVGQNVNQKQVIGKMGSTGRSTGTHLHFEIRKKGRLLNPLGFLR